MGHGYGKCQFAFQKTFLQLKSNTAGKCQEWVHNEAKLETLIGRIFFSSPFLSIVIFPPYPGDTVFTATLIKSEQIISFKLQTPCSGRRAGIHNSCWRLSREGVLYSPLVGRREEKVRNMCHAQSLQELGSGFKSSGNCLVKGRLDFRR